MPVKEERKNWGLKKLFLRFSNRKMFSSKTTKMFTKWLGNHLSSATSSMIKASQPQPVEYKVDSAIEYFKTFLSAPPVLLCSVSMFNAFCIEKVLHHKAASFPTFLINSSLFQFRGTFSMPPLPPKYSLSSCHASSCSFYFHFSCQITRNIFKRNMKKFIILFAMEKNVEK